MITQKAGMPLRCTLLGAALWAGLAAGSSLSLASVLAAPGEPGAESAAAPDRAKQVLTRIRGMLREAASIRYDGSARVQMPDGRRIAVSQTKVIAEQIDAGDGGDGGGWKILVEGTFGFESTDPKATKKDNPVTVRAAWDGLILTALQEKRKIVRRTAPVGLEGVQLDMNQADAAATVAWEMLAKDPFASLETAQKVEFEEPEKVGEAECDVLWVVPAAGKNPPVPYRLLVSKRDGLPRRLEKFRPAAARQTKDKRGEPGIVITYDNLVASPDLAGVPFAFEAPKGFTVSNSKNLPTEAPKTDAPTDAESPTPTPTPAPTPAPAPSADAAPKHPLLPSDDNLIQPGRPAPPFKLTDFEGKERTLDEFKGKVLVLDFWGSWCPPCVQAMPAVQRIHEKFAEKGVVVLGMNFEQNPKADPVKFKKAKGFTYPSVTGAQSVSGLYRLRGWPTFYVIGKDGKVVWGGTGLASPPGGAKDPADAVRYLEGNLTLAIESALK